jgi:hypothetical protein
MMRRRVIGLFMLLNQNLFSVTGQVDVSWRSNLLSDTLTRLVFIHESLSLLRKTRVLRIVQETVGVLCKIVSIGVLNFVTV